MPRSRRLAAIAPPKEPAGSSTACHRPPQEFLQFERRPLTRTHLVFLILSAGFVIAAFPQATGPVAFVCVASFLAELAPVAWRRYFFAEIASFVASGISFFWAWHIDGSFPRPVDLHEADGALLGWIRMLFVTWILIPSRPGFLRFLAVLFGFELILLGVAGDNAIGGWAPFILVPLTAGALIADAAIRIGAALPMEAQVGRSRRRALFSWAWMPVLLVCCIAIASTKGILVLRETVQSNQGIDDDGPPRGPHISIRDKVQLNGEIWSNQDQGIAARLFISDPPTDRHVWYMRKYTLPVVDEQSLESGGLTWQLRPRGQVAAFLTKDNHALHSGPVMEIVSMHRMQGNGEAILRPDGSAYADLFNMEFDSDENLSRTEFGELARYYRVDIGRERYPQSYMASELDVAYSRLPERLQTLLQASFPEEIAEWRQLKNPAKAAREIKFWLDERADYSLKPDKYEGSSYAGGLLQFLQPSAGQRGQGHCQYFASSATVLMRAAGYACRIVTGYSSDEIIQGKGVVFRNRHAHAWAEYMVIDKELERTGKFWNRFDPTPATHLSNRAPHGTPGDDPFPADEQVPTSTGDPGVSDKEPVTIAAESSIPWIPLLAGLVTIGIALAIFLGRRRSEEELTEATLKKETEALVSVALELGITVHESTTLTQLANEVQRVSGIDLSKDLQAHLAARFANGPLPEPWPIDRIRAGRRNRRSSIPATPTTNTDKT